MVFLFSHTCSSGLLERERGSHHCEPLSTPPHQQRMHRVTGTVCILLIIKTVARNNPDDGYMCRPGQIRESPDLLKKKKYFFHITSLLCSRGQFFC